MIIGLTGGSGAGKTEIARIFAANSYEIIDYDKLTREIYTPNSACLADIRAHFGDEVFENDGSLKRKALGAIVFGDRDKLALLNSIVYKYLLAYTAEKISNSAGKRLVLDAPTLFEAGLNRKCDVIIGVISEKNKRIDRISLRDSLSRRDAENRINSQKSDGFYRENCDYIIVNSGDMENLHREAMTVLRSIENKGKI